MDSLKNRITKEFEELNKNKSENNIEVWLVDSNVRHWKGKIKGPVSKNNLFIYFLNKKFQIDTCYQGGEFIIDIVITEEYPFKPPKVRLITFINYPP